MPYYGSNNYGWGDALAAWGQALSGIAMKRDEDAINRIKNYYGNNVEAWRQDALKNPGGQEAKYYKKLIGDPARPLPEDPQVAQQRAMREQQAAWINSLPPEQRQAAGGLLSGISPEIVGTVLRQIAQKQQPAYSPEDRLKTIGVVMDKWPNATPKAMSQMTDYGLTGQTPAKVSLESTPGQTANILGGMAHGGTAGLVNAIQKSLAPSTETELLGEMGPTKQQVKIEDTKARLKMAQDKMAATEENRKKIDERFQKSQAAIERRWQEGKNYKMTPEERMDFTARMKKYGQDFQLLNRDRADSGARLDKLKARLSALQSSKAMMAGTEMEADYNASIQDLTAQIAAEETIYNDLGYKLDSMELPGKSGTQANPNPQPQGGRIPLN